MSGRTFDIAVKPGADVAALLQEARSRAAENGITLRGDAASGTFSGAAEGTYRVEDRTVVVEVRSKPLFVPWALIESALRRLFAAGG